MPEQAEDRSPVARGVQGVVIDSVVVSPENVFSDEQKKRWWVYRFLNSLHTTTRKSIVESELSLGAGDSYDTTLAYESERLLRDLPFLFDAEVWLEAGRVADSTGVTDSLNATSKNVLNVRTIDKWSLGGGLQASRKGGRNFFEVGLKESNLFGRGHKLQALYAIPEVDPDFVRLEYSNPRFMGLPGSFGASHNSNPLDRVSAFSGFFGLIKRADRYGSRTYVEIFKRRQLRLLESDTVSTYFEEGEALSLSGIYRIGDFHTKLTFGTSYSYLSKRVIPGDDSGVVYPADSVIHSFGQAIELVDTRFVRTRSIKYLGRTEDLRIDKGVVLGFSLARGRRLGSVLYQSLSVRVHLDHRFRDLILESVYSRQGWYDGGSEFSSRTRAALRVYYLGLRSLTVASRFAYQHQRSLDTYDPLTLDEATGVRGHPINYKSGDRFVTAGFELRTRSLVDILSTSIGLALFSDVGAIWRRGGSFDAAEKIWSIGPGLRLDLAQGGGGRIIRMDFAYSGSLKAWQFSTGVGQYFDALSP